MTFSSHIPSLIGLAIVGLAALAFVVGAMMWLKRLRQHLAGAVGDALTRQIQHGQKVEETLMLMERRQKALEVQVQTLAQAQARARADIAALTNKLGQRDIASDIVIPRDRMLH